jgi:hypothetical protein
VIVINLANEYRYRIRGICTSLEKVLYSPPHLGSVAFSNLLNGLPSSVSTAVPVRLMRMESNAAGCSVRALESARGSDGDTDCVCAGGVVTEAVGRFLLARPAEAVLASTDCGGCLPAFVR